MTTVKKQLIWTVVWSAVFGVGMGVMLAQRDNDQRATTHVDNEGFEAWEGAENSPPASGPGAESGEAAIGDAAEVAAGPATSDGPHGARGGPPSAGGNADGRGEGAPDKASGAGEF